jgi:hypothetical protein
MKTEKLILALFLTMPILFMTISCDKSTQLIEQEVDTKIREVGYPIEPIEPVECYKAQVDQPYPVQIGTNSHFKILLDRTTDVDVYAKVRFFHQTTTSETDTIVLESGAVGTIDDEIKEWVEWPPETKVVQAGNKWSDAFIVPPYNGKWRIFVENAYTMDANSCAQEYSPVQEYVLQVEISTYDVSVTWVNDPSWRNW